MSELTYFHKSHLSEALLCADDEAFPDVVVPADITPDVAAFATELSPLPLQHIPRIEEDNSNYGWPADNVHAKIQRDGGDIRFGWRLREWPGVLLMANFHAAWLDPQGALIDITADITEGDTSLFLPIPTDTPAPDPTQNPAPRYYITHRRPDTSADVADRIARMKPAQRAYEERRASKAGTTLEQWLNDKHHPDLAQKLIPLFIKACQRFDENLLTLPESVAATIARIEQARACAVAQTQEAADISANTFPQPPPIDATDAIAHMPEPDSASPAGDTDNAEAESESDRAYDEAWDAFGLIGSWSESRRLFRNSIVLLSQGP